MENYKHIGFTKSTTKNKKYDAILKNKITGQIKKIPFGDLNYQQYRDSTGLKLYSHLDHLNNHRKLNYFKRHNINYPKYSADYFSKRYLWS